MKIRKYSQKISIFILCKTLYNAYFKNEVATRVKLLVQWLNGLFEWVQYSRQFNFVLQSRRHEVCEISAQFAGLECAPRGAQRVKWGWSGGGDLPLDVTRFTTPTEQKCDGMGEGRNCQFRESRVLQARALGIRLPLNSLVWVATIAKAFIDSNFLC